MLSPDAFALGHLAIVVAGLVAFALWDRRSRDVHHHWHRTVRCRHISTDEVMRMIEKAAGRRVPLVPLPLAGPSPTQRWLFCISGHESAARACNFPQQFDCPPRGPPGMFRSYMPLAMLALAIALGGCNEMAGASPGPVVDAPPPAAAMSLPAGAACSNEINKFQAVLRDDLQTGNVAQSVYDAIQRDLDRAASACSAGKGAQARSIVAATKAKHGYRA